MGIKEKQKTCSRMFLVWTITEKENKDMAIHDKDIEEVFTSAMILKKFDVFGIDIVLPDLLLLILDVCVEGKPGLFQVVLKDLLNNIKQRKGPIPTGYIITAMDFAACFMMEFPITEIPHINDKYYKLWNEQKKGKFTI